MTKLGQTITNQEDKCVQLFTTAADGSIAIWDIRPPVAKVVFSSILLAMNFLGQYDWTEKTKSKRSDRTGKC